MEPGTGKTRTAYELIKSVPDIDYCLWLTPFRTKKNLKTEIDKYGGLDCDIVGIESLSNSDKLYLDIRAKLEKAGNPFIVCDESLKIKNWGAKRTRRILDFSTLAEYKLILNGTPLSRNILDLWAQLEFLNPKILKMKLPEYKDTFCIYTEYKEWKGGYWKKWDIVKGYTNVDYLISLIHHYVYDCEMQLSVNKQYYALHYQLTQDEKDNYYEIRDMCIATEMMEGRNNNIFLYMVQKLQHSYCCAKNKIIKFDELIQECDMKKTIVFCKYIKSRDYLEKHYPGLTVLTYGKHSFGLNLQSYNTTIFWDKTWDYAQRLQCEQRTYRTGQNNNCTYYDMTGGIGLEKLINDNIEKKVTLLDYFKSVSIEELKKVL